MKQPIFILILTLISQLAHSQHRDPYSTPPGAPLPPEWPESSQGEYPSGNKVTTPKRFTIVESQSTMTAHDMDAEWFTVLTAMGHLPTIVPQTTLDGTAFFSTTDVLVVSSGIITLTPARINTLVQWVQNGGPLYIQGEYLTSYTTNQAFGTIITSTGGTWTAGVTIAGTLAPMNILYTYATTTTAPAPLSYFWYGATGTGCNTVQTFLTYGGNDFGYAYCPGNPAYGSVLMTTDQDWVRTTTSPMLLENMAYHLANDIVCSAGCGFVLSGTDFAVEGYQSHSSAVSLKFRIPEGVTAGRIELVRSASHPTGEQKITLTANDIPGYSWQDQNVPSGDLTYHAVLFDYQGNYIAAAGCKVHVSESHQPFTVICNADGIMILHHFPPDEYPESVTLYSPAGQKVLTTGCENNFSPLPKLPSGVYIAEVRFARGGVYHTRFLLHQEQ